MRRASIYDETCLRPLCGREADRYAACFNFPTQDEVFFWFLHDGPECCGHRAHPPWWLVLERWLQPFYSEAATGAAEATSAVAHDADAATGADAATDAFADAAAGADAATDADMGPRRRPTCRCRRCTGLAMWGFL